MAGTERLPYGGDYRWTPPPAVAAQVASLDEGWRLDPARALAGTRGRQRGQVVAIRIASVAASARPRGTMNSPGV